MALDTYTNLQAALASWLMREDLTDAIPDFIALTESRAAARLRVSEMEITATASLVNGSVALPDDFIEPRRIISNATGAYNCPLELITPDFAGETYPSSASGAPVYYAIYGGQLTTYPNGGTAQLTMVYYAKPPALATHETNWLLTKAPDVYLYGSLLESAPYLGDDQRTETWAALFEKAVTALQSSDQRARYAHSVSRVRGVTP